MIKRCVDMIGPGRFAAATVGLLGFVAAGQAEEPVERPHLQVPQAPAEATPKVSGEVDDPAWAGAAVIAGFSLPVRTKPAERALPTEVRLLWDKDWLYVRFISTGPEPYAPFGKEQDAKHYLGDAVEVFLDPVGDGKQYFEFQQSPAGGVLDQNTVLTADAECDADGRLVQAVLQRDYWPNLGYTMPDARYASGITKQNDQFTWTADFALPAAAILKRTGKKNYEPMTLRMNLLRYHHTGPLDDPKRKLIAMNWSPVVHGCPHQSPGAMGTIELVLRTPENRQ